MDEFLRSLDALQWVFFISAVGGGCLFVVRMILMVFAGFGGDADFHVDHADAVDVADTAHGGDPSDGHHGDGDAYAGVKILSFQGIMAFFTMFGLTGLGCLRGGSTGAFTALGTAVAVGILSAWVLALLVSLMVRMQASGTLDIKNAVGQVGTVYLTLPAGGEGKVQVSVQGRQQVLDAISEDKGEIKTGERIRVVGVSGTSTLVVEKA